MRRYIMKEKKETETIICNGCGKEICVTDGIPKEDMLSVEKRWGYFSGKDMRSIASIFVRIVTID